MRLFLNNIFLGEVSGHKRKLGELFPRLVGIRVSNVGNSDNRWIDIEPMYIPLVRITRRAGQVLIEINNYSRPLLYITLQWRKPFISVFRFPWEQDDTEG